MDTWVATEDTEDTGTLIGGKGAVKADATDRLRPKLGLNNVERFGPTGENNARVGILATPSQGRAKGKDKPFRSFWRLTQVLQKPSHFSR